MKSGQRLYTDYEFLGPEQQVDRSEEDINLTPSAVNRILHWDNIEMLQEPYLVASMTTAQ